MMESLPVYLKIKIFNTLNLKDFLSVEATCKNLNVFIKKKQIADWDMILKPKITNLQNIMGTFKFRKFDFRGTTIEDKDVAILINCHTLDLSNCKKITNESVKMLGNCHTLNLSQCVNITDDAVKMLVNCDTINLSYCRNITEETIKMLEKKCTIIKKKINVYHGLCIHEKCNKLAMYNTPTQNIGLYCCVHKKNYMIDVTKKYLYI